MDRVKTDITLISPPSRNDSHFRPPLALMYVAEYYRTAGKKVKIIDLPITAIRNKKFLKSRDMVIEQTKNRLLSMLGDEKEIGISCYSTEFEEVKSLIKDIRKKTDVPITIGGIHPTLYPDDFFGIAGIKQGRCDVGYPSYDLVDMEYYLTPNPYAIRGVYIRSAYVLSSIGCPSNCAFCVAPRLRPHFGCGYIKTAEQLANEVKFLKDKYSIDGFYVIDDCFTISKDFVKDFCARIKKSNLVWGCSSRVNTIDEPTIRDMARSGCIQMDFGVERGSNEELKRVKKGQTIEQVKETFSNCRKNKIRTFGNFLVGIEGENRTHLTDIETLIGELRPTIISVNSYQNYSGTELKSGMYCSSYAININRNYNKLKLVLTPFIKSKKKLLYLKNLWALLMEVINQKFQS